MEVICIKGTSRLIKGEKYKVIYFDASRIDLEEFGYFTTKNFRNLDGSELTGTYGQKRTFVYRSMDELKAGDLVIPLNDSYKYLIKGEKYRIKEVVKTVGRYTTRFTAKLEGYNRSISVSPWTFRKLSLDEARDIALSQILDKPENFSVDFIRKFDKSNNKNKILMQKISKSIMDRYRHNYSVIEWAVKQQKNIEDVRVEDFSDILNMTLGEILESI